MKILYYSSHPHLKLDAPTGYGTHMREMIAAWRRMGLEVKTFIAGDRYVSKEKDSDTKGVTKKSLVKKMIPSYVWESLKDAQLVRFDKSLEEELRKVVKDFEPDIIYERVAYLQNSGIKISKALGIKHIAEINAPYPEERVSFSGKSFFVNAARNIEREILVHSYGISTVSSALKDYLVNILPNGRENIEVVPNAVNQNQINHSTDLVKELKRRYDLLEATVVGFVGSIFPYHGVDILIEAFGKLPKEWDVKLLIVGDGEILSDLKARVRVLGLLNKVVFTGSVPHRDVYPLIENMDICCMAKSNWYGSPVKIFEYGLMQKAVLAPDVIPVRDVMEDEDGILVNPEVEEIKDALTKLIENREMRRNMADNWHQKVLKNYTWDVAASKTLSLCT